METGPLSCRLGSKSAKPEHIPRRVGSPKYGLLYAYTVSTEIVLALVRKATGSPPTLGCYPGERVPEWDWAKACARVQHRKSEPRSLGGYGQPNTPGFAGGAARRPFDATPHLRVPKSGYRVR